MRCIEQRKVRTFAILRATLALPGLAGWLAGCGSIEPVEPHEGPITNAAELYMRLTLDHPAANLSLTPPYNTVQLTATPRDALGNPMAGLPAPTYSTSDTTKLRVTAGGLVTALATVSAPGLPVVATVKFGPVTHTDTALISVKNLPTPPGLGSLSIEPVPPDSAVWPWQPFESIGAGFLGFFGLAPKPPKVAARVTDTLGGTISGIAIYYTSLDSTIATVNRRNGNVSILRVGKARMVAQTTAYGVTRADTVMFTVTPPFTQDLHIQQRAGVVEFVSPRLGGASAGRTIHLAPGGLVFWFNYPPQTSSDFLALLPADSTDVTFDDPTHVAMPMAALCTPLASIGYGELCGAGNVLVPPVDLAAPDEFRALRIRQFPVAGVYPFRTSTGASGRIVVSPELAD